MQFRRGVHRSTRELETAIKRYLAITNAAPTPFVWTKTADEILESVARFCRASRGVENPHPDPTFPRAASALGNLCASCSVW